MEEGRRGGNSSRKSQKRAIKFCRYISEAQKYRLLAEERHDTSPEQRHEHAFDMAKFIKEHANTGNFESPVGKGLPIGLDMEVVTGRIFGQPVIKSISKMMSEFCREKYDTDLGVVNLSKIFGGHSVLFDGLGFAQWFHLNFEAMRKDGDDGYSKKVYFAEVAVFKFRTSPLQGRVTACLPIDDQDGFGNHCKCMFAGCDILHPSSTVYERLLMEPDFSAPLFVQAQCLFDDIASNWMVGSGRSTAWVFKPTRGQNATITLPPYKEFKSKRIRKSTTGTPSSAEASAIETPASAEESKCYLKISNKMSKAVPVPTKFGSLEGKRGGTSIDQLKDRALAMEKRLEKCRTPMKRKSELDMQIEWLLKGLQECFSKKYNACLDALDDFKFFEGPFNGNYALRWKLVHMHFSAKVKSDNDDGAKKLYFAELVAVTSFCKTIFHLTVCCPVDENDAAGNSSNCGMCKLDLQICHPDPGSYFDDAAKVDVSMFRSEEGITVNSCIGL